MYNHISNIDRIKLELIAPASQVIIFHSNGDLADSCDTLIRIDPGTSVFDQFDFLKSIEEVFPGLPIGERLTFDAVEWTEGAEGLFAMEFVKTDSIRIQWIIQDRSKDKAQIAQVQQERNESAINEEFLEIQRKYLEVEKSLLNYKNDELHRIQKFKEQFFAEVSHEMRTPLNSISGLIDLLKSTKPDDSSQHLAALKATSNHLNAIINDVLDLSKIEAGKFELTAKVFNFRKTLGHVMNGFSVSASNKGVALVMKLDDSVPTMVEGDEVRLSQVLYNLLGNALKFTEKGSVSLSVASNRSERGHKLSFMIADTGKGMSGADIEKILKPYAQMEGQDHQKFGGTGLGLGIAQRLIELMGGGLEISSEKGKGTSMSFVLELGEAEMTESQSEATATMDLGHLKILFVEDDEIGLLLFNGLVAQTGIRATFSKTIEDFHREVEKTSFDFIVSDVNLPDGNMISAIQSLRGRTGVNRFTRVIFLSGDEQQSLNELETLEGFNYLMKPIRTDDLLELLTLQKPHTSIDLGNLKASTQGDKALMKEIMATIVETLPLELDKLMTAGRNGEFLSLQKVLHKINPSINYLGNEGLISERSRLYVKVSEQELITDELSRFCQAVTETLARFNEELQKL